MFFLLGLSLCKRIKIFEKVKTYIYLRSYRAYPVGCIGSTSFDAIAKASAVYQLRTSFVGAVVDDLETDGEEAGEVLPHGRGR